MKLLQRSDNNNPWGKGSGNSGPPDLENMIKNIFKGKGGGTRNNGKSYFFLLPFVLIAFIVLWALSGIYVVQPAEQAAVMRFGKYIKTVNPGMHWYPRFIDTVTKVNVDEVNTIKLNKEMLTSKENIVHVSFTVQYRVGNVERYLFNVVNPVNTLSQALDSSVRQSIGQNQLDKILTTGRAQITGEVREELEILLKSYKTGIQVNEVVMQPAKAPDAVKSAFDDVIKAREDREKMQNIAESYSNRVVPIAKGKAQRLLDEAAAYKKQVELQAIANIARFNSLLPIYRSEPEIIKSQIYFDTMQSVLEKNKVFIVDGNGNNNLFYWPKSESLSGTVQDSIGRAINTGTNNIVENKPVISAARNSSMTKAQYLRWMEANK